MNPKPFSVEGFEPGVQGVGPNATLAGGRLPAGAAAAVVRDRAGRWRRATCANGAWLVVLAQSMRGERPVGRFLDAAGRLASVPLEAGVTLEPVDDAQEPCPVCGASDWGRVVSAPRGRYGEDRAGRPTAAVCRECGHAEALGVLSGPWAGPSPAPADVRAMELQVAREMTAAARAARFTLFGLGGHKPTVAGHGSHDDEVDSVSLAFDPPAGRMTIETSTETPWAAPRELARSALEGLLHERDTAWPERSQTATLLWLSGRDRHHAADAATAPVLELAVTVDGMPTAFAAVAHAERFAALGQIDDLTITVAGHGAPTALALSALRSADL